VNASESAYTTRINLEGVSGVSPTAVLTTLQADFPEAENSLDQPEKYVPVRSTLTGIKPSFETTIQPYSISILRIQDPSWKKQARK
jgi:alpha-N-arabinofuranosidase